MHRLLTLALVVWLGITAAAADETPAVPETSRPRSILWVGAHPDDEIFVSPLLADLCQPRSSKCTLLVLTRGEAGHCLLPRGCRPSLGVLRSREMARSARPLHANLILWDLPDSGGPSGQWADVSGGEEPLIERLAATIAEIDPDLVLTFDPRHGTTCHGDHRKTGELVIAAVETLPVPVRLDLLETMALVTSSPFSARFVPAAPPPTAGIVGFDAKPLWSYVPITVATHRSQFPPEAVRVIRKTPARERMVFTAPAPLALASNLIPSCR